MKIGILTFHCAHNYGAVLQAYATQHYLKSLGHDVAIIDYQPDYLIRPYKLFSNIRTIKSLVKSLIEVIPLSIRRNRFKHFINNELPINKINLNKPSNYDVFIYGSDQIWNPKITQGLDRIFLGEFTASENKINIAYAASSGSLNYSDVEKEHLAEAFKKFHRISVREHKFSDFLSTITESNIPVVLDPTFLVEKKTFEDLASFIEEDNYVLIYQVVVDKRVRAMAKKIANKLNCKKIIEITNGFHFGRGTKSHLGPSEFLSYFKHARYVVTTSFHGTAFALILEKPFTVVSLNEQLSDRSRSLLSQLELANRIIEVKTGTPSTLDIDYKKTNEKLAMLKEQARCFIKDAIENPSAAN